MLLTLTPNPCVDKTLFIDSYAPGMRLRSERCTYVAGGKGNNVSRVAQMLGHATRAINVVGGPVGDHVLQMLEQDDGIDCVPCRVEGMTRTITTVLEEASGRQTAFFDPGPEVRAGEVDVILRTFQEHLGDATLVTLNGTVPDPSMASLYRECIALARAAKIPVIMDAHGVAFAEGLKAAPDAIKPNLEEAAEAVGFALDDEASQWRAVDWFHAQGVALVVLSRGAEGLLISRGEERLRVIPAPIQEVNPVGSGDSLVAGLAIGMVAGWPLERIARYGAALGTANAARWEICVFDESEVEPYMDACIVTRI